MRTRLIASTEAQNNFGRMLDDAVQNNTRYVIRRRNASQAILLSIADFESLLAGDDSERKKLEKVIRELRPLYSVGEAVAE
jgi:PHD/YefM family antitoxin component YafN of YafNO toxin-antitoxin module